MSTDETRNRKEICIFTQAVYINKHINIFVSRKNYLCHDYKSNTYQARLVVVIYEINLQELRCNYDMQCGDVCVSNKSVDNNLQHFVICFDHQRN